MTQSFPIRAPRAKILAGGALFGLCSALFVYLAATGRTDVAPFRGLGPGEGVKVALLWVMAVVSAAFPVKALLLVMGPTPVLLVAADHAVVPYGLNLRKRQRLTPTEITTLQRKDFGAGTTLHVGWAGGNAYLPSTWFSDEAPFDAADAALRELKARG